MKVEDISARIFNPVTIAVTFETQEELEYFYRIAQKNITIPELLKKEGMVAQQVNSFMYTLNTITKTLIKTF